jgi:hypothetical protein
VACLSSPSDWAYADPILAARQRALSPAIHAKAKAKDVSSQRTHRAARAAVSRKKHKPLFASTNSFRAMAARLLLLRPIATALHAFRPVA